MKSAIFPLKLWLAIGLVAVLPFFEAHGESAVVGGRTWIYTVKGGKATVTGATPANGTLKIPSKLGGHPVTGIGYQAFCQRNVTVVKIPSSVKNIGDAAFAGCRLLQEVTIGNNVTNIGVSAFDYCRTLSSVTFGKRVKSIGDYAFYECYKLVSVKIPNSVKSIGWSAFYECTGLEDLTIGNHVKTIGGSAFSHCYRLKSVKLPASVTNIGSYAFFECESLKSVNIPNGVKRIEDGVFRYCWNLKSVTIPSKVKSIGASAFSSCGGLKSVTIPASVKNIGASAFSSCSGLTTVKIGNGVTNIGSGAFQSCTQLKTASLGSGLKNIDYEAFRDCAALASVTIPDSVKSIGDSAFYWCRGLTSVEIGDGVKDIGQYAFYGCDAMKSLQIGNSVTNIAYAAFQNCSSLTSLFIPGSVAYIDYKAFKNCTGLKTLTIASGVQYIASDAFEYVENNLETLYLAASMEGSRAWRNLKYQFENNFPVRYLAEQRVDFNAAGGNCAVASKSYLHSRAYGWLPTAKRTGYGFAGWFTQASGGTQVTKKSAVTDAAERTLYAHWNLLYTVKFKANGGKGTMSDQRLQRDVSAKLAANKFKRSGYAFMGWSKTKTGPVAYADKASVKNLAAAGGSITLHARWAKSKYKVAFNANGGTGTMASQSMTYGKSAKLRKNAFVREGYVFAGWSTSKTGQVVYKDRQSVKNLRTDGKTRQLYAQWKRATRTVELDNGTGLQARTVTRNNPISPLPSESDCGRDEQAIWTPETARASAKAPGNSDGCVVSGTLPAGRVFSADDSGVFGIGDREIEISPDPPPVEELGNREWAVEPEDPLAVTFRVPEAGRVWQLWSAERGILADEETAGETITLQLPDLGIWYWLRFLGAEGETLASSWLFPAE